MKNKLEIKWAARVAQKNIADSEEYLSLVFNRKEVRMAVCELTKQRGTILRYKAKDILRASRTQLLPETNENVRAEFVKILNGIPLMPVCLVRKNDTLFIADGYHRTCAAYYLSKDAPVHCIVAGLK